LVILLGSGVEFTFQEVYKSNQALYHSLVVGASESKAILSGNQHFISKFSIQIESCDVPRLFVMEPFQGGSLENPDGLHYRKLIESSELFLHAFELPEISQLIEIYH